MLRSRLAFLALVPAMALGYAACTGEVDVEDPEAVLEEEAAIAVPSPDLIGTFRHVRPEPDRLAVLTLKSDGTYHRGLLIGCYGEKCRIDEDDGEYKVWYRGGESFMSLFPNDAREVDEYRYILRDGSLRLRPLGERIWHTLEMDDGAAWCATSNDCALQNLPVGPCASDWYCSANVCTYSCQEPWPEE